jgi:hypothetical protein
MSKIGNPPDTHLLETLLYFAPNSRQVVYVEIGEVTKLYNKNILLPNRDATTPPLTHLHGTTTCSSTVSLAMLSNTSPLELSQPNMMCVVIKDVHPPPPPTIGLNMQLRTRVPSEVSNLDHLVVTTPQPPIVNFDVLPAYPKIPFYTGVIIATPNLNTQQDNCSTLVCHLFAHVKNLEFNTKAEVLKWCLTNIKVNILWHSSTVSLVKIASTKVCRSCAAKRMIIGQNFTHAHRQGKILNLKSELHAICS